jgi:hypothetical protein
LIGFQEGNSPKRRRADLALPSSNANLQARAILFFFVLLVFLLRLTGCNPLRLLQNLALRVDNELTLLSVFFHNYVMTFGATMGDETVELTIKNAEEHKEDKKYGAWSVKGVSFASEKTGRCRQRLRLSRER